MSVTPAKIRYSSNVGPKPVTIVVGVLLLAASVTEFWVFFVEDAIGHLVVGMVLLSASLFVSSLHVRLRFTGEELFFTLSNIWRKSVHSDDIVDLQASKQYIAAGYGWRWLGPGVIGYMVGGPCVSIRLRSGKEYIVSVENPSQLESQFLRSQEDK